MVVCGYLKAPKLIGLVITFFVSIDFSVRSQIGTCDTAGHEAHTLPLSYGITPRLKEKKECWSLSPNDVFKICSQHLKFSRKKTPQTLQLGHHGLLLEEDFLGQAEVFEHPELKPVVLIGVVGIVSLAAAEQGTYNCH